MSGTAGTAMRGVVQTGQKRVAVVDVPRPVPADDEVLVRVAACGICGSDLHMYRREWEAPEERPRGHEAAGEVVAVGRRALDAARVGNGSHGAPELREGGLVAIDFFMANACGACGWCRDGFYVHCERRQRREAWNGPFAEYVARTPRGIFALPAGMSGEDGALVEPLAVSVHGLRLAGVRPGETVAIIGAGTIGQTALIAAKAMGARDVVALARHPHQAALAKELGASAVVTGPPEEAVEAIQTLTGGTGADVVVETVGGTQPLLNQAWEFVRRRGRVVVLGLFHGDVPTNWIRPVLKEVTVHGSSCYGELDGRHDFEVAIEMIASGEAPVGKLVTHRFPLEEATQAFETADDKRSGAVKVLLIP